MFRLKTDDVDGSQYSKGLAFGEPKQTEEFMMRCISERVLEPPLSRDSSFSRCVLVLSRKDGDAMITQSHHTSVCLSHHFNMFLHTRISSAVRGKVSFGYHLSPLFGLQIKNHLTKRVRTYAYQMADRKMTITIVSASHRQKKQSFQQSVPYSL
jgi:hypothetical protein